VKKMAIENMKYPPVLRKLSNDRIIKIILITVGKIGASISHPDIKIFSAFMEKYIPIKNIVIAAIISG
tara:strand:+ start:155 stop:358 length:204 start_codon:yes stop_codon:yes gene_type:complete